MPSITGSAKMVVFKNYKYHNAVPPGNIQLSASLIGKLS